MAYWPKGDPPASFKVEFEELTVFGDGSVFDFNGLRDHVVPREYYRGAFTLPSGQALKYWRLFVSASVKVGALRQCKRLHFVIVWEHGVSLLWWMLQGTSWWSKLKMDEGIKEGLVVLLESTEEVERELHKLDKFAKVSFQGRIA